MKTFEKAGLDAKVDILNPKAHGSEVGSAAKVVGIATSPTTSKCHDPSVRGKVKKWFDGISKDEL